VRLWEEDEEDDERESSDAGQDPVGCGPAETHGRVPPDEGGQGGSQDGSNRIETNGGWDDQGFVTENIGNAGRCITMKISMETLISLESPLNKHKSSGLPTNLQWPRLAIQRIQQRTSLRGSSLYCSPRPKR
jgi:hypothetical protein